MANNNVDELRLLESCVGTVSSCQVLDHDLIIFSAGRGPLDTHTIREQIFLDSLRVLEVMVARARCNLVIIVSITYMTANCPSWRALISHFRGTTT